MDQESETVCELPTPINKMPINETPRVKLVDVRVTNQNEALQLIVTFLNLAQKRGSFTLDESAKIWECIKIFQQ